MDPQHTPTLSLPDKSDIYRKHHVGERLKREVDKKKFTPTSGYATCRVHYNAGFASLYADTLNPGRYEPPKVLDFICRDYGVAWVVTCEGDVIDKWWKDLSP